MASNARARFFNEPVLNPERTRAEGRPVYDDTEMVELIIPGDRLTRGIFLANEPSIYDKETGGYISRAQLFDDAYKAFKRGEHRAVTGTPLEMWPVLTRARVMEIKAAGILSVEELASVSDSILGRLGMGARDEREQARAWLAAAKGSAEVQAQATRIAQLEDMVQKLPAAQGQAPAPEAAQPEPVEKAISDCSDDELKAFIKDRKGSAPRGTPSRDTLERLAIEASEAA